jgi:hypothetical protein
MFFLPEEEKIEAWKPSKSSVLSGNQGSLDRKIEGLNGQYTRTSRFNWWGSYKLQENLYLFTASLRIVVCLVTLKSSFLKSPLHTSILIKQGDMMEKRASLSVPQDSMFTNNNGIL